MKRLLLAFFVLSMGGLVAARAAAPPIYVTLWFDTEDYILPQDDDATKRLAEMLTRLGVKATFKIVGEKARALERRGRDDVIAALKKHDIGFHSNLHSQQPTVAVYLQHAGWEDGIAEFRRRESPGVADIERIFGVTPVAYGQPGSAWAPQAYPALQQMGIGMYLDESNHVGLDDQPFYFDGMLNVFRMRSMLVRMELDGGSSLADGKTAFMKAYETLAARGGGTISIYYHPNEWVQAEFWDAVNFSHGANPPPEEWKRPGTRPAAETKRAFEDFEQYIRFIASQDGVRFVTATDLMTLYADRAIDRRFDAADLTTLAKTLQHEISFHRFEGYALSAADTFALLNDAMAAFVEHGEVPASVSLTPLYGPTRPFRPGAGTRTAEGLDWEAFARAIRDTADFCRSHRRMPDEVWIGARNLSPADYLATLADVALEVIASGKPPRTIALQTGRFTADRYVAADSPELWSWPIFPEGFHAPQIMELARLQAWTLKPAILQP